MQITRKEKGKIFLQLELQACRKASMQITREENCPWGVWIGVALTFGWQLRLAKIDHQPLHRLARDIHSRVSCKWTGWGKTIFFRIFISICAQASATVRLTARWRRLASLRERICKTDYVNPYYKKTQSAIRHETEEPEVTEPLNIISANCSNGCPIAENRLVLFHMSCLSTRDWHY